MRLSRIILLSDGEYQLIFNLSAILSPARSASQLRMFGIIAFNLASLSAPKRGTITPASKMDKCVFILSTHLTA